ncbi:TPA: 50S ribosomal protein L24 [Patescibacteria group bacterium]|nr:50S ribosomal protein L24 [Patescibacteria group bacterium]
MKIKKGDTIKMLYGKDAGRQGTVIVVDAKKARIVVEGLNMYKRHLKGDGKTRTSEIVTITKPVPVSKVMLICPQCNKATRVGYKIERGVKNRICKKCGESVEPIIEEVKKEKKVVKKKTSTTKKTTVKKKTTTKKSNSKKTKK